MHYPENLSAWHDQVREDVIDPAREITDPHHHFWADRLGSMYELPSPASDLLMRR